MNFLCRNLIKLMIKMKLACGSAARPVGCTSPRLVADKYARTQRKRQKYGRSDRDTSEKDTIKICLQS